MAVEAAVARAAGGGAVESMEIVMAVEGLEVATWEAAEKVVAASEAGAEGGAAEVVVAVVVAVVVEMVALANLAAAIVEAPRRWQGPTGEKTCCPA